MSEQDRENDAVFKTENLLDPFAILEASSRTSVVMHFEVTALAQSNWKIKRGLPRTQLDIRTLPQLLNEIIPAREYEVWDFDVDFATIYDLITKIFTIAIDNAKNIFTLASRGKTQTYELQNGGYDELVDWTQFKIPHDIVKDLNLRPEISLFLQTFKTNSIDRMSGVVNMFVDPKFNNFVRDDVYPLIRANDTSTLYYVNKMIRKLREWREGREKWSKILEMYLYNPIEDPFSLVFYLSSAPEASDYIFSLYASYLRLSVSSIGSSMRDLMTTSQISTTRISELGNFINHVIPHKYNNNIQMLIQSYFMMGYVRFDIDDDLPNWTKESKALVALTARLLFYFRGDKDDNVGNLTWEGARKLDDIVATLLKAKINADVIGTGNAAYEDPLGAYTYNQIRNLSALSFARGGFGDPSLIYHEWDFLPAAFHGEANAPGLFQNYIRSIRFPGVPFDKDDIISKYDDMPSWHFIAPFLTNRTLLRALGIRDTSAIVAILGENIYSFFKMINRYSYRYGFTPLLPARKFENIHDLEGGIPTCHVTIQLSSIAYLLKQRDWDYTFTPSDDVGLASGILTDVVEHNVFVRSGFEFLMRHDWRWESEKDTYKWLNSMVPYRTSFMAGYHKSLMAKGLFGRNFINMDFDSVFVQVFRTYYDMMLDDIKYFRVQPEFVIHARVMDWQRIYDEADNKLVNIDSDPELQPVRLDLSRILNALKLARISAGFLTSGVVFNIPCKVDYKINTEYNSAIYEVPRFPPTLILEDIIKHFQCPHITNLRVINASQETTLDDLVKVAMRFFVTDVPRSSDLPSYVNPRLYLRDTVKIFDSILDDFIPVDDSGVVL